MIDFEAKRNGYANIKYSLELPSRDIKAQFESINEIRDEDDFDVSAKVIVRDRQFEQSMDFTLGCKSPEEGAIDVKGTLKSDTKGRVSEIL